MSYSIQRAVSDGTLTNIALSIVYVDRSDIHVYVDDIEMDMTGGATEYTWDWLSDTAITITPAVANDSVVLLRRVTKKSSMYHDFNAGAVFKDTTVDENFLQVLYIAQEAIEGGATEDFYNDLDLHGYTIHNSGPALVSGDLVTLGQYQSDALGAYAYRKLSERYANDPYGVQVEPGKYSAFHWATVAASSITGVASVNGRTGNVILTKEDVGLGDIPTLIDAIDTRIDGVDTRIDGVDTRIDGVDTRIDGVDTYIDSVEPSRYTGSYGLSWDSLTDTYIRTGASGYTAIQSQMKRCVLNDDGTVNYFLNPTNSNFKADGTPSNLAGADGNVMVQVPAFYVKYTMDGTLRKQEVSLTADTGFTLHPAFIKGGVAVSFRYAPAYRGILMSGKLRSVSGVAPTMNRTIIQFRADSIANGVGWHLNDWLLYNAVRTLCTIEIGTLNTQAVLGNGNHTGNNYTRATGVSNTIGNGSSDTSIAGWMSYRGIEDFYASSWQFMDGINIQNYLVFVNGDYRTFASDVFTGDYVSTGVTVPAGASSSYIKDMNFSVNGMIPTMIGGASNSYVTDALWSATGNRIALVGGTAANGLAAGAFCLAVDNVSATAYALLGAGVSF